MSCRLCGEEIQDLFVDLGATPVANSFLSKEQLKKMEPYFPLDVHVCRQCFLVQVAEYERADDIFNSDYAYFSSFSDSWLAHCKKYVEEMSERFALDQNSQVIEVASNDGYLLQYFKEKSVPVLGVEPTANTAKVAMDKGIPTEVKFFGEQTAKELIEAGKAADLMLANNVVAHVPDLNDFLKGFKIALKPEGRVTFEFPHLKNLMDYAQFDTIYHEHFSYFSFLTIEEALKRQGLEVFDVQELPTHGGSLRVFAKHAENTLQEILPSVESMRKREQEAGYDKIETYKAFDQKVKKVKNDLLRFLIDSSESGKRVVGYGAPAKGNTLLNYCGVKPDLIEYTVDRSTYKQNLYLPGTRIPIYEPEKIMQDKPDYVLILPWNLKEEIKGKMSEISSWGGKFVVAIPELQILD